HLSVQAFYSRVLLLLLFALCGLLLMQHRFLDEAATYSAFGSNLMMSALFIAMLRRRNDIKGQSVYIALSKMLGTFTAFLTVPYSELLTLLYLVTFCLDLIYTILLYDKCQAGALTARQEF